MRAFLLAEFEVGHDLGHLHLRGLCAHHRFGIERVALLDGLDALQGTFHELVVDRFLNQRARRAGAHLALVEGKQHQAFDGFVEEVVVGISDVFEEDVGALAAQFQRGRNQVVGRGLRDDAAGGGGAGERDLGDALAGGQRHAGFAAVAVDDVEHARRQQVGNQFGHHQDADRRRFGGLEHHAVAGGDGRSQLPGRHQDREVPRDDLPDHAQRFMEMVGDGVLVDLAQRPPSCARRQPAK